MSMLRTVFAILLLAVSTVHAEGDRWPRQLPTDQAQITMFQPQLELFDGTKLEARAAVSIKRPSDTTALYGAVWISSTVNVDRDLRMVYIKTLQITNVRFPESVQDQEKLKQTIGDALKKDLPPLSLDELVTAMDAVKAQNNNAAKFKNDPPEIIYATSPTVLVFIDGEPRYEAIEKSDLKRIVNTPFPIFLTKGSSALHLYTGQYWYTTTDLAGKWTVEASAPKDLAPIAKQVDDQMKEANGGTMPKKADKPSTIIVRTKPSELLMFTGEPSFDPIVGTQLMAAKNTEASVFMDISSQLTYVVLSGRWFRTKNVKSGPWEFVASDALPADFAKIPEGSTYDEALAYVAGTSASREAVLDASIPQTAAVDRASATCTVTYKGEPEFKEIEGTSMKYAVNTSSSVLMIDGKYFACDNGVWFESSSAKGPWVVSTKRPDKVDEIPPTSPVYNTKYVYVYESTPTVVYVGYTPGYTGSYVMGPTVVYGTGYWYHPYGPYYYPYHATYGFHMVYSPYHGWSAGVHVHYGYGGYWGPPMYRPPYYHHPPYGYYGNTHVNRSGAYYGGYPNRNGNVYRGSGSGSVGTRPGVQPARPPQASTRPTTQPSTRPSTQPSTRPSNNVMTDRSGNVYRPSSSGSGFESHNGSGWQQSNNAPTRDLQNSQAQRDRSQMRSSNSSASRPSSSPSTRQSAPRGGGGGGRRR